jgi:hypothetical protein
MPAHPNTPLEKGSTGHTASARQVCASAAASPVSTPDRQGLGLSASKEAKAPGHGAVAAAGTLKSALELLYARVQRCEDAHAQASATYGQDVARAVHTARAEGRREDAAARQKM